MTCAMGNCAAARLMGFGEEELDALKHPALISVLANANVSWCSVSVNREVLRRLLSQAQDVEKEIATVDRMLRLGASTEMVSRFYGLTHQEVALRREILGLPKRKGRHPVLDEEQDTELWRRWKAVTSSGTSIWRTRPRFSMRPWTWPKACRCRCRWSGRRSRTGSIRDWVEPWPWTTPHHARWPRRARRSVRRCAERPAQARAPRRRRLSHPATASSSAATARERAAAAVPRPSPDAAGAQRLAGVPADAQRRRRDRVPDL
jgi:hypothetical protein